MQKANISDIRALGLAGMIDRNSFKQIRIHLMLRMRLTQPGIGIDRLQSHMTHQPPHSFLVDRMPDTPQPGCHLRNTVEWSPRKLLINQPHQHQIAGIIPLGTVVIR